MMKLNLKRGFTLIELLVVIAIIGILSGIVLSSLNSARTKGADAAVKGTMNSIRSQAELYYSNNANAYGTAGLASNTTCNAANTMFVDPTIVNAINQVKLQGGGTVTCAMGVAVDAGSAQSYVLHTSLKGGGTWCIDSGGNATSTTGTGGGTTAAAGVAKCQ